MKDLKGTPGHTLGRVIVYILAITMLAALVPYFVFYAPGIKQSIESGFTPAAGIVWLKIHIVVYSIAYSLYFMSLLLAIVRLAARATTRFPWIETATLFATVMVLMGLITGVLYSRHAWNTWWVWDAKNTVVLINTIFLFFISLFVMLTRRISNLLWCNTFLVFLLFAAVTSCIESLLIGFFFRVIHPQWLPFILFQR